jgi:hypothetical protein
MEVNGTVILPPLVFPGQSVTSTLQFSNKAGAYLSKVYHSKARLLAMSKSLEVTDSDKHSSLLRYGRNYDGKILLINSLKPEISLIQYV